MTDLQRISLRRVDRLQNEAYESLIDSVIKKEPINLQNKAFGALNEISQIVQAILKEDK